MATLRIRTGTAASARSTEHLHGPALGAATPGGQLQRAAGPPGVGGQQSHCPHHRLRAETVPAQQFPAVPEILLWLRLPLQALLLWLLWRVARAPR